MRDEAVPATHSENRVRNRKNDRMVAANTMQDATSEREGNVPWHQRSPLSIALLIPAALLIIWAAFKGFIVGYYPGELIPQILIPLGIGGVLYYVSNRVDS